MEIDNGSDVMNTTSHKVYQTGEGEMGRERPRTSENQASENQPLICVYYVYRDVRLGSISAALSCPVYVPPRKERRRSAGSVPEQRLVIEPNMRRAEYFW